ncbi:uncharacterized protein LOC62_02G002114 [Vanrija pseudolonga]|uniref:Uncharacterized protein n=1 Tax=Vanrija pseudolonga TaxID=143232 RepID=A0AAF1BNW6_9TREE|nr:hypothetical protein LOC62_02G002114 [Vanrija pseudolonga]
MSCALCATRVPWTAAWGCQNVRSVAARPSPTSLRLRARAADHRPSHPAARRRVARVPRDHVPHRRGQGLGRARAPAGRPPAVPRGRPRPDPDRRPASTVQRRRRRARHPRGEHGGHDPLLRVRVGRDGAAEGGDQLVVQAPRARPAHPVQLGHRPRPLRPQGDRARPAGPRAPRPCGRALWRRRHCDRRRECPAFATSLPMGPLFVVDYHRRLGRRRVCPRPQAQHELLPHKLVQPSVPHARERRVVGRKHGE